MRSYDSLIMPGLIEDVKTSSVRKSLNTRSEIIDASGLANSINQQGPNYVRQSTLMLELSFPLYDISIPYANTK
jgi:hypothetical protein